MYLVHMLATETFPHLVTAVSLHFRPMTHGWLAGDELYAVNLFPDLSLTEGDAGRQSLLVSLGSSQSLR